VKSEVLQKVVVELSANLRQDILRQVSEKLKEGVKQQDKLSLDLNEALGLQSK
jgi:hypothetical protein